MQGSGQALRTFSTHCICWTLWKNLTRLSCYSTLESPPSKSSLGRNNETPVSPINRFSFCSTVRTIRCHAVPGPPHPSPQSPLPSLILPPPPSSLWSQLSSGICLGAAASLTWGYLKLPALAWIEVCLSLPSASAQTSGMPSWGRLLRMLGHSGVGAGGGRAPFPSHGPLSSGWGHVLSVSGSSGVHVFMTL